MTEKQARFQQLLKPIGDLASSWNIDIANELRDYLEELDSLVSSFDDGNSILNFAEAALLIQGTACIYSKKVESLYDLVYKTLGHLTTTASRKRLQPSQGVGAVSGNTDDTENNAHQDEVELGIQDHMLEASSNIMLKRETEDIVTKIQKTPQNRTNYQEAVALMSLLIPDERDRRGDFKLSTCVMRQNGALLIEDLGDREGQQTADEYTVDHGYNTGSGLDFVSDENRGPEDPQCHFDADDPVEFSTELVDPLDVADKGEDFAASPSQSDDPWEPLDPYEDMTKLQRPFRKGNTFKRMHKGDSEFSQDITYAGCLFSEFDYILANKQRHSNTLRHAASKRAGPNRDSSQFVLSSTALYANEDDEDDQELSAWDIDADNDQFGYDTVQQVTLDSRLQGASNTYDALCRSHIESYMQGAEEYVTKSDLFKKVEDWQGRLLPMLRDKDSHPPFDIHQDGSEIVHRLEDQTHTEHVQIPFENVVQGKGVYQICRMFLASLQLANSGNIELHHASNVSDTITPFEIELVTAKQIMSLADSTSGMF